MTRRICPECETKSEGPICPRCGTRTLFDAPSDPGIDPLIGKVFDGRYRIEEILGKGGMGAVYKAVQIAMNKVVAVKVVKSELASNVEAARRFHREAKAASRLSQPHSIRVFDFGQTRDRELFMVMEYIEGRSLGAVIRDEKRLPAGRAAKIGAEIAQALIEAHGQGFIHRDLKPDNVVLLPVPGDPEFVKVLDFGIAKFLSGSSGDSTVTRTGAVIGTPQYMAPEQARARNLSTATDIYGLGIILYEMLSGRVPFTGETPVEVLMAHVNDPLPPLPAEVEAPEDLVDLMSAMLAKQPSERPSAREVFEELEAIRFEYLAERHAKRRASRKTRPETPRANEQELGATEEVEVPVSGESVPPSGRSGSLGSGSASLEARGQVAGEAGGVGEPKGRGAAADVAEGGDEPAEDLELAFPRRRAGAWLWWGLAGISFTLALVLFLAWSGEHVVTGPGGRGEKDVRVAATNEPDADQGAASGLARDVVEAATGQDASTLDAPPQPDVLSAEPEPEVASPKASQPDIGDEPAPPEQVLPPPPPPADLRFVSTPSGAAVHLGAKRLGTTPFTHRFAPDEGRRTFVFRKPGYRERSVTARVKDGAVISASLAKEPPPKTPQPVAEEKLQPPAPPPIVTLRFVSQPPGAEVYVGPVCLGETEFSRVFRADAGRVTFRCTKTGYKDVIVIVDVGRARVVRCRMEPLINTF